MPDDFGSLSVHDQAQVIHQQTLQNHADSLAVQDAATRDAGYSPDASSGEAFQLPGQAGQPPVRNAMGAWAQARLPASWRGVPFRVRETEIKRGRRQAVHEYPFRDLVWVEDMGRSTRITAFRGFIVGDDIDSQLKAMMAAAEAPGPGTLVHPALGQMTASLLEFTARDQAEHGRVVFLEFVFVSASERIYPAAANDTQAGVASAATSTDTASAGAHADAQGATGAQATAAGGATAGTGTQNGPYTPSQVAEARGNLNAANAAMGPADTHTDAQLEASRAQPGSVSPYSDAQVDAARNQLQASHAYYSIPFSQRYAS